MQRGFERRKEVHVDNWRRNVNRQRGWFNLSCNADEGHVLSIFYT